MSACFPVRLQPQRRSGRRDILQGRGIAGAPGFTADAIDSATVTILNVQGSAQEGSGPGLRRFQTDVVVCSAREIAALSTPAAMSLLTMAAARPALRSAAQLRPGARSRPPAIPITGWGAAR